MKKIIDCSDTDAFLWMLRSRPDGLHVSYKLEGGEEFEPTKKNQNFGPIKGLKNGYGGEQVWVSTSTFKVLSVIVMI